MALTWSGGAELTPRWRRRPRLASRTKFGVVVQGTLVPPDKLKHYHSSWRRRFGDLPFDYEAESILLVAEKSAASLLIVHGLIMNGGVHHAIECIEPEKLRGAIEAYPFFGFDAVATFLLAADSDPVLMTWTDETELAANTRYVPDDSHLFARFENLFGRRGDQFAPID